MNIRSLRFNLSQFKKLQYIYSHSNARTFYLRDREIVYSIMMKNNSN